MDREALIKKLDDNFSLAVRQDKDTAGRGYKLCLRASWNAGIRDVMSFRVQLVGINPLTGENVEDENITAVFSFDSKDFQTRNLLTYHGKFYLRCTAVLGNGETIVFRTQEVALEYERNKPEIVYTVRESQGFRLIEIRSNCWGNCRGKVWITIDGHDQCVDVPAGSDRKVRFYMSGAGSMRITVQEKNVILRQEG